MADDSGQQDDVFRLPSLVGAVSSVPGGVSLFAIDRDRIVHSTYYDPRVLRPEWGPWFPIRPELRPSYWSGAWSSAGTGGGQGGMGLGGVGAVSTVPGGISLFAIDGAGVVWSTYFDPRLAHAGWEPWFAIHPEQRFAPLDGGVSGGISPATLATVSTVPGGISLFATDIDGVVNSTYFDPRVTKPDWVSWFPIHPEKRFWPIGPVTAVSSVPGGVSLFAVDRDGIVMSTYYDPRQANPDWVPWFPIHGDHRFRGIGTKVVLAVSSVPGGLSLFVLDGNGTVWSSYFDPRFPNANWVSWFPIHPDQGILALSGLVSSAPGGISLFALDQSGSVVSTYFDPRAANPSWVPWFSIHPETNFLGGQSPVAASTVPGGISLFAVGNDHAVWSSYYDPRDANPRWVPWFAIHPEKKFERLVGSFR